MIDRVDHLDEKLSLCRYRAASYSGFKKLGTPGQFCRRRVRTDAKPSFGHGDGRNFDVATRARGSGQYIILLLEHHR
jgi:hypothetical protein